LKVVPRNCFGVSSAPFIREAPCSREIAVFWPIERNVAPPIFLHTFGNAVGHREELSKLVCVKSPGIDLAEPVATQF